MTTSFSRSGRRAIASAERLVQLGLLERELRVGPDGVLDRVDQRDLVAAALRASRARRAPPSTSARSRRGSSRARPSRSRPSRRSPRRSARASASAPARRSRARSRARVRGRERGTQSSERSSSMIAPLMRAIAYVSNLISRSGVEPLDRADQPEQPVRDEVLLVDVRREARTRDGRRRTSRAART